MDSPQPAPAAPQPVSRPTLVKICGITSHADGLAALEAGADWLGFIRWPKSPRWRAGEDAARMLAELRAAASRPFAAVGVYVDWPPEEIEREVAALGLDRVQLHGRETPGYLEALRARLVGVPLLKVLRIRDAASLAAADDFPDVDLLTDTDDPALPGGTGRGYDYALLRELTRRRRVLIAGGLTPHNVGAVVGALRPWGVDVSSGVEKSPGIKDHALVRAFIHAVRESDPQINGQGETA